MSHRRYIGFSLIEVMAAAAIILIVATSALSAAGKMAAAERNGDMQLAGGKLAEHIVDRMYTFDINDPASFGATLFSEVPQTGVPEKDMGCVYFDPDAACTIYEHGSTAELDLLFDTVNNPLSPIAVDPGIPPIVWYEGRPFYVTWNVARDFPLWGMLRVQVIVAWEPFHPTNRVYRQMTRGWYL